MYYLEKNEIYSFKIVWNKKHVTHHDFTRQ
jgi:hypothetical protein